MRLLSKTWPFLLLFIVLNVLITPKVCFSVCGGAPTESPVGTWTTYDASYDCVNDCVQNYATTGETVTVANGNATWTSPLVISKSLVLKGGSGTITYSVTEGSAYYVIDFYPTSPAGASFEMSGFTFTRTSGRWFRAYNTSYTATMTIKLHNNILNSNDSSQAVRFKTGGGVVYGVVYSNTFNNIGDNFADLLADGDETWANFISEPGRENNLFFEDNIINMGDTGDGSLMSGQGLKGFVARFNTITQNGPQMVFEMHGTYSSWGCGTMLGEFYGNKVIQTNTGPYLVVQRGGQVFGYYNALTGSSLMYPQIAQDDADGGNCLPEPDVQDENVSNSYYWNQRSSGGSGSLGTVQNSSINRVENTHFWIMRSGTFNGSGGSSNGGGVGCGTLANRPACTSGCSIGVGYWIPNASIDPTASSCSDFTSYVGANNTLAASVSGNIGTLWKLTANGTWASYYTPYTYPHPLRGGGDSTPPVISGLLPSGQQRCSDTTWPSSTFTLSANTDETATCKYATSDVSYDTMGQTFSTTGTTAHSQSLSLNCGDSFSYYVRCMDTTGNKDTASSVSTFAIDKDPAPRKNVWIY